MTLSQLNDLTDDELGICLFIVNVIDPTKPPLEIPPRGLTWFPHEILVKKLLNAFPQLHPEYHTIYQSLLTNLGIAIEIKLQVPEPPPQEVVGNFSSVPEGASEPSGSISLPSPEHVLPGHEPKTELSSSLNNESTGSI